MEALGQTFLEFAVMVAFGCLLLAFAFTVFRLVRGPSFADRVVALDFLMLIGIGFIAVKAVVSKEYSYIDVAIAMALVGFLATVALSRYIYRQAQITGSEPNEDEKPDLEDEDSSTRSPRHPGQGGAS